MTMRFFLLIQWKKLSLNKICYFRNSKVCIFDWVNSLLKRGEFCLIATITESNYAKRGGNK